jgi:uncharacterized Zn-finger protein
VLYFA